MGFLISFCGKANKMSQISKVIKSKNVAWNDGVFPGQVVVSGNCIVDILEYDALIHFHDIEDVGEQFVFPGLVDCHVHINEPGRTLWEGFDTATKAAAAGGITSLIEMPLNASPVTTTSTNFHFKLRSAHGKIHVNCGFWGGLVPDNLNHLEELLGQGVFGLKAFLTHSGIDDFPNSEEQHLKEALLILKKHGKPLLVHCELDGENPDAHLLEKNPRSYEAYLKSRPKSWENDAIDLVIKLCRETGARVHIVHLSSAEALPAIRKAKAEGLQLSVETCPQYLVFNAEDIKDGQTAFKCAPPIREKSNNDLLWEAVKDGTIDFIVTDHSPAPPDLKEIESGDFKKAWGGVAGLQFLLPAFWTEARKRGIKVEQLVKLLSRQASIFCGLDGKKGKLASGYDADIMIWEPESSFILTENMIEHRHKVCPYTGLTLFGVVKKTIVGGLEVFDSGKFVYTNSGNVLMSTE